MRSRPLSLVRFLPIVFLALLPPAAAYAAWPGWFADEVPPANAKPLSEIIKALEDQGYKTITEVEFEDGVWEIEVHQPKDKEVKLKVDAVSGEIKR